MGSYSRSASWTATKSPVASRNPVRSAAPFPWFFAWRSTQISGCLAASLSAIARLRSREQSSTRITSTERASSWISRTRLTQVARVCSSLKQGMTMESFTGANDSSPLTALLIAMKSTSSGAKAGRRRVIGLACRLSGNQEHVLPYWRRHNTFDQPRGWHDKPIVQGYTGAGHRVSEQNVVDVPRNDADKIEVPGPPEGTPAIMEWSLL